MLNTMMTGWVAKSLIATVMSVPFLLVAGVFGRVFKIAPESMIFYWLAGSMTGIAIYLRVTGKADLLVPNKQLITVAVMGLIMGSSANILLFQAIVASPNPGIPMTILGSNSAIVFILGPLLAIMLPRYFQYMKFDIIYMLGILLTITGVGILTLHK